MPERIQLRRSAGWRKPPGAVVVSRPSVWGNPYPVGSRDPHSPTCQLVKILDRARAVELFEEFVAARPEYAALARQTLAGKDLGCWCPLNEPCHADVLLRIANEPLALDEVELGRG